MPVNFDPAEQRTAGWIKARQGCLTASRMADAMDFTAKGAEGSKRRDLKIDVIAERLTDSSVDHYVNAAMKHGMYWESAARVAYEEVTGNTVKECGFALHGEIAYFGASPDGLVGSDGLVEIKCPTITTHVKNLLSTAMPETYIPQMLAQLAVTRRKWCDFVSFFPSTEDVDRITDPYELAVFGATSVPKDFRIKVWRFNPTLEQIEKIEASARLFLDEVDAMFDQVILGEAVQL